LTHRVSQIDPVFSQSMGDRRTCGLYEATYVHPEDYFSYWSVNRKQ